MNISSRGRRRWSIMTTSPGVNGPASFHSMVSTMNLHCDVDRKLCATLEAPMPRQHFEWKFRDKALQLGERTLMLGVLNVTPDSFSDGGKYLDPDRAFARAIELEEQGADIIDIGAESTRPGAERVSEAEELRRLIPVLKRLQGKLSVPVSVDTYKSA